MKTIKLILLLSVAAIISSCKPTDNGKTFVFDLGKAVFYGDLYHTKSNVFDVYLLDNGLDIDNKGFITGSGYFLYLDLNTPNNTLTIPNGNYEAATNGSNFTFQKGSFLTNTETLNRPEGSYIAKMQDDQTIEFYLIDKGSLTISGTNTYMIKGQAVSTDGVVLNFTFNGKIDYVDRITPMPQRLTKGELWFFGNRYNNGLNVFSINLGDDDTNMTDLTGGGDMMQIEVYTPLTYTNYIPDGIYPVYVDNAVPKSVIDGYIENKIYWGTWYYTETDYQITQGTLSVQRKNGNTYNLAFDMKDKYDRSITRTAFDISLGYFNMASPASKVKQMMRVNSAQKRIPMLQNRINIRERIGRIK